MQRIGVSDDLARTNSLSGIIESAPRRSTRLTSANKSHQRSSENMLQGPEGSNEPHSSTVPSVTQHDFAQQSKENNTCNESDTTACKYSRTDSHALTLQFSR